MPVPFLRESPPDGLLQFVFGDDSAFTDYRAVDLHRWERRHEGKGKRVLFRLLYDLHVEKISRTEGRNCGLDLLSGAAWGFVEIQLEKHGKTSCGN